MKEIELDLNRAGYFGYGILALLSGASILIAVFLNAFIPQELQKMFEINLSGFNDFLLPLFIGGLMSTVNGISTTKKAFSKDLKKTAE
ncbi:hypothetical protein HYV43_05025 [Candidatus Micrarchaeota archaeon]|nr:hypothetical protein [Candidatus Micrarchaeota archaeon]